MTQRRNSRRSPNSDIIRLTGSNNPQRAAEIIAGMKEPPPHDPPHPVYDGPPQEVCQPCQVWRIASSRGLSVADFMTTVPEQFGGTAPDPEPGEAFTRDYPASSPPSKT